MFFRSTLSPQKLNHYLSKSEEFKSAWYLKLLFLWPYEFVRKSQTKSLERQDLLVPPPIQKSEIWASLFWRKYQEKSAVDGLILTKVIGSLFWRQYAFVFIVGLISVAFQLSLPGQLKKFLESLSNPAIPTSTLFGAGLGCIASPALAQFFLQHLYLINLKTSINVNSGLVAAVYRKSMRLHYLSKQSMSSGNIINLMGPDSVRIRDFCQYLFQFLCVPIQIVYSVYFLVQELGSVASLGLLVMLALIPVQTYLVKRNKFARDQLNHRSDARISRMNEVLKGIKPIKFLGWDIPFLSQLNDMKIKEGFYLKKFILIHSISLVIYLGSPLLAAATCFTIAILQNNRPSGPTIFACITLFTIFREILGQIPGIANSFLFAYTSAKRFNHFMRLPEKAPSISSSLEEFGTSSSYFQYSSHFQSPTGTPTFRLNLAKLLSKETFAIGKCNTIVGHIGAGKSTLALYLAGELSHRPIRTFLPLPVSLNPQTPWILSGTIQENILFYSPFNLEKYQRILEICDLILDLSQLPNRDQTIVGEQGMSLSGGQKQRIQLARTLYSDAQTYILDDPFSALDQNTTLRIFNELQMEYAGKKTILLITHNDEIIANSKHVIKISEGEIHFQTKLDREAVELCTAKTSPNHPPRAESAQPPSLVPSIKAEQRKVGSVSKEIYFNYLRALSSPLGIFTLLFLFAFRELATAGADWWISRADLRWANHSELVFLSVYLILVSLGLIFVFLRVFILLSWGLKASHKLHLGLLNGVLKSPLHFFDTTPIGQVLNRFSKDTEAVDSELPSVYLEITSCIFTIISTFCIIFISNSYFILFSIPILMVYFNIQNKFRRASREVKRMEDVSRSPIYAHFSQSLSGVTFIRNLRAQRANLHLLLDHLEYSQNAFYTKISINRWLAGHLVGLSAVVSFITVTFALMQRFQTNSLNVLGMAITSSFMITNTLNWAVRMFSEVESGMSAVERITEFSLLKAEHSGQIPPPKGWPSSGTIEFDKVTYQYPNSPTLALLELSVRLKGGSFVGIQGRTGSGKSSIISALFGVNPLLSGEIYIDGVPISTIPLPILRRAMSIIPQDPNLFSGTLRYNLDPFNESPENDINSVLNELGLGIRDGFGASFVLAEEGNNLSSGQKQLLCLARALLRKNRIVIMDEATSQLDPSTETKIKKILSENFQGCTRIVIAHRLHTIEEASVHLTLEKGRLVESKGNS